MFGGGPTTIDLFFPLLGLVGGFSFALNNVMLRRCMFDVSLLLQDAASHDPDTALAELESVAVNHASVAAPVAAPVEKPATGQNKEG